ncbi:hypothetical protein [Vibrio marisflavi]|uniref:Phosphatidylinositol diacylglycerol-lyase n=1 Tax=Vibrio marisflavi CECT 7928 TaxID=634439 RepID=A0ABM9A4C4_9VIBR|nr:hypothetical protein [Vibrio marisflavi]CAH0539508.1 hypothetical protein VMF7928_02204 [Vibrio marisflavi CECT 7928]
MKKSNNRSLLFLSSLFVCGHSLAFEYHDNQVKFLPNTPYILPTVASNPQTGKASPLNDAYYYLTGVKVSNNQDPSHLVKVGSTKMSGAYKDGRYFTFTLGRHGTDDVANWFKQQLGNDRGKTTFNDLPKKLNFAFKGDLTLYFNKGDTNHGLSQYKYSVKDVVIAQGHTGTSNNWWAAAQRGRYIGDHRIQVWGKRTSLDPNNPGSSENAAIVFRRGGEIWDPLSQILNPSDVSTIEYQVPNSVQCIYNGTPNVMRLTKYHDGLLKEEDEAIDQVISPFASKCFRTEISADVTFTLANDGDVEHTVHMTANTNIKSEPNYDGSYNDRRYMTELGALGALRVSTYSANQTSIYKIEQKSVSEPVKTADWMADFADSDKIENVMLPASHDAGMSTGNISHCAVTASPQVTQTQTKDILGQLESGARYFDIRPTYTDSVFGGAAGYFTYHGGNQMSCNGQPIVHIPSENRLGLLNQALQFVSEHPTETLILKFSHVRGVAAASKETVSKAVASLVRSVFSGTNQAHLYMANRTSDISGLTFGEVRGKVIVVLDTTEDEQKFSSLVNPTSGLWGYNDISYSGSNDVPSGQTGQGYPFLKVFDHYSNANVFQNMFSDQKNKLNGYQGKDYNWFLLSWTLTQSAEDALNTYPTILGMAVRAHAWLPEKLPLLEKSNLVYLDNINPDIVTPVIYNSTAVTIKNLQSEKMYVSGETNRDIRLSKYQHVSLGSLNNKGNHIVISELQGPICTITINTSANNLIEMNNFRSDIKCNKVRDNLVEVVSD